MNELYQSGIIGMHWGIRRFQNKDGSLTRAGKKRFKRYRNNERRDQKQKKASENLLRKQISSSEKKYNKLAKQGSSKASESLKRTKYLKKKYSQINNGTLKAGQDYLYVKRSHKLYYVSPGLAGIRLRSKEVGKNYLLFNERK